MAIFVSNPTSAAVQALSGDALDPSAIAPEEGFTEELAAAMQPIGSGEEPIGKAILESQEEADQKATDLQILPAEVLMNAVGDANFAFAAQAGSTNAAAVNAAESSALTEAAKLQAQELNALELELELDSNLQSAELAAQLAAASAAAAASAPAPMPVSAQASSGQALQALDATGAAAGATNSAGLNTQGAQADNASSVAVTPSLAGTPSIENVSSNLMPAGTLQVAQPANSQAGSVGSAASNTSASASQAQDSSAVAANSMAQTAVPNGIATTQNNNTQAAPFTLVGAAGTSTSSATPSEPSSLSAPDVLSSGASSAELPVSVASGSAANATSVSTTTSANNTVALTNAPVAQSGSVASDSAVKLVSAQASKLQNSNANNEESAFNFDAKISANVTAVSENLKLHTNVEPASNMPKGAVSSATPASGLNSQGARLNDGTLNFNSTLTLNSDSNSNPAVSSISPSRAASIATASTDASITETTRTAPTESSPAAQSLEGLSSSFVSSLVGGPQRPVHTVMDLISLQSQERPAPVVPHEVRLDAGAVQLEIQKMVKQGGGHVVMELTPPDQSKFTIELKLDERGGALLIVEGVSDSTKTRLEQSAPQLREQFQQMGLELQLDMRQQGQSASSNAADFWDSQERGSGANHTAGGGNGDGSPPSVLTQREAGAIRARETGANQVYLYA